MVTELSEPQFWNAPSEMLVRFSGKIRVLMELQPWKA